MEIWERKMSFFRGFHMFDAWNTSALSSLLVNVNQMKFDRNQAIFREGERPDNIYFIYKGEVELTKTVQEEKTPKDEGMIQVLQNHSTCLKQLTVAILGARKCFGEEEPVKHLEHRLYTAIAKTPTWVYHVSIEV